MRFLIALVVILLRNAPSLTSAVDITITGTSVVLDSLVADNLSVTATAGSITNQSNSNIAVTGQATFTAATNITLGTQLNNVLHFGALDATAVGSITIAEHSDMSVSARALGGDLSLTSPGNMFISTAQGTNIAAVAFGLINNGAVSLLNQSGVALFSGDFTQSSTGSLGVMLGGTSMGSFNRYTFGDDVTLAGLLNVSLSGGFSPNPGDVFDILNWSGTLNGAFSNVTLPPGIWDTSRLLSTGEIEFVGAASSVPEPSTLLLLVSGLTGFGGIVWRRQGFHG